MQHFTYRATTTLLNTLNKIIMEEIIIPVFAMFAIFGSIIVFTKTLTDFSLKKRLIDRDMVNAETADLFKKVSSKQNALKWGLVALFAGLGLIINSYVSFAETSPLPFGIEAVCVAIGFLIYYFMVRNDKE